MTHLFTESVHCELHLTRTHYCFEDAVEGYAVIAAEHAFLLDNAHLEIVGGERVGVTVDQVEESTTPEKVQYGVSRAEYVYFRVLYTLAGRPLTYSPNVSFAPLQPRRSNEHNNNNNNDGAGEDNEGRASHHYYYYSHGQGAFGTSARTTLQNSFAERMSTAGHSTNPSFIGHSAGFTETGSNAAPAVTMAGSLLPHGEGHVGNRSMAESRPLSLRNDSLHRSFMLHALLPLQHPHHGGTHGDGHTPDEQGMQHAAMAEERGAVRFPAGRYVYPFHCLLPAGLPASYETGTCVKDKQYSVSKASLQYYVKLRLLGKHRRVIAHARADFVLQPQLRSREPAGATGNAMPDMSESVSRDTASTATAAAMAAAHEPQAAMPHTPPQQPREQQEAADSSRAETAMAARLRGSNSESNNGSIAMVARRPAGRTVVCRFHAVTLGGLWTSESKVLLARLTLPEPHYAIGRDRVKLHCVFTNLTGHNLSGLRLVLRQELTFRTHTAKVTTSRDICTTTLDAVSIPPSHAHKASPHNNNNTSSSSGGKTTSASSAAHKAAATAPAEADDGAFALDIATDVIPHETHVLPTLHTAGLRARYVVRLELLSGHVAHGHYEFDDVCLVDDLALPILEAEQQPQQPQEVCEAGLQGSNSNNTSIATTGAAGGANVMPLAPGKLTRPEHGIYLVPRYPVVAAVLPTLKMLSHFPSPMPSHNPTRMHSRLPSPTAQ